MRRIPNQNADQRPWDACPQGELQQVVQKLRGDRRDRQVARLVGWSGAMLVIALSGWLAAEHLRVGPASKGRGDAISCQEVRRRIGALALGEAEPQLAERIRRHLGKCARCRCLAERLVSRVGSVMPVAGGCGVDCTCRNHSSEAQSTTGRFAGPTLRLESILNRELLQRRAVRPSPPLSPTPEGTGLVMSVAIDQVKSLTFDLFGTVLDLSGSLTPFIAEFLQAEDADVSPEAFWNNWRARQRIEQYQDTITMLGHSGYLETARRALIYTMRLHHLAADEGNVQKLMESWNHLSPFPEVKAALPRLSERFTLVALSNGNRHFLDHLVQQRIAWDFDAVFSVDVVGAFKPHPAVYRRAARDLQLEPGQCMMVSANSFDVMGARACGLRGAFVNRLGLPYEDSSYQPDLTVADFSELADALVS